MLAQKVAPTVARSSRPTGTLVKPSSNRVGRAEEARPPPPWDFAEVPLFASERASGPAPAAPAPLPGVLQAKLAVGPVDDPLEREADRVADRMMRMPDPAAVSQTARSSTPMLRRKCACEGSGKPCATCSAEQDGVLKRKATGTVTPTQAPPIVHEVLRSPGQPLDAQTRAFFEPRFGYDFGSVRIHADAQAAQSAEAVGAVAYTVGHDVVFAERQYAPDVPGGRKLLAHELTHVLQQNQPYDATLQRQSRTSGADSDAGTSSPIAGAPGAVPAQPAAATASGAVCGPNVTTQVAGAITALNAAWNGWTPTQREEACWALEDPSCGPVAWDIVQLHNNAWIFQDYRPACATAGATPPCGSTVQVGNDCHYAGSVNYVIFGRQCKLCDIWKATMHLMILAHKIHWSGIDPDYGPAEKWADAGYAGWSGGTTPAGDRNNCSPTCLTAYGTTAHNAASTFDFHWAPSHSTETVGSDCTAKIQQHRNPPVFLPGDLGL